MIRTARLLPLAALAIAGAALAQPPGGRDGVPRQGPGGGGSGGGYANPSALISAEMAKGRLAIEKGEWTALARTGAKDAILFTPDPVFAQHWLKGRKGMTAPVRWQTQQIFMACNGREGVTTGTWSQQDGERGWYSTIWRRDPKAGFQWIFHHGGVIDRKPEPSDEIVARVARCKRSTRPEGGGEGPPAARSPGRDGPNPSAMLDTRQPAPMSGEGRSQDGSLRWRWAVAPDKSRTLEVWMATDEGEAAVVSDRVPQPVS